MGGSDPLPIGSQEAKVGIFGFYIKGTIDLNHPAKDIENILSKLPDTPNHFGKFETSTKFFKNQLRLHIRKVFKKLLKNFISIIL